MKRFKMWIGIDPGQAGALAAIVEGGKILIYDWKSETLFWYTLETLMRHYDVQKVCIEELWGRKGSSAKSTTTFMKHVGALECMIKLKGLKWFRARPQDWMKRRVKAKSSPTDKPAVAYVQGKYPQVQLHGPKGGIKDGRADALCMAEYCKENFK